MRKVLLLALFLGMFLPSAVCPAQTVPVFLSCSNLLGVAAPIYRIELTPLFADTANPNYFQIPDPIILSIANMPSLTNGYAATNLAVGWVYGIDISSYSQVPRKNVWLPETLTNMSGPFNLAAYQTPYFFLTNGLATQIAFEFPNEATTNILVPLLQGYWDPAGIYSNNPAGYQNAAQVASAVTAGISTGQAATFGALTATGNVSVGGNVAVVGNISAANLNTNILGNGTNGTGFMGSGGSGSTNLNIAVGGAASGIGNPGYGGTVNIAGGGTSANAGGNAGTVYLAKGGLGGYGFGPDGNVIAGNLYSTNATLTGTFTGQMNGNATSATTAGTSTNFVGSISVSQVTNFPVVVTNNEAGVTLAGSFNGTHGGNGSSLTNLSSGVLQTPFNWVADGDSLTAASVVTNMGQIYWLTNPVSPLHTSISKWAFVTNAAVSGEQINTMWANWTNNILPWSADHTGKPTMNSIWGGVNDVTGYGAGEIEGVMSNYVNCSHLHGNMVTIFTIPYASNWGYSTITNVMAINAWIRLYSGAEYVVDIARMWPTYNGAWTYNGSDNVHFSSLSDFVIAQAMLQQWSQPPFSRFMVQGDDFRLGALETFGGQTNHMANSTNIVSDGNINLQTWQGSGLNPTIQCGFGGDNVGIYNVNGSGAAYVFNNYDGGLPLSLALGFTLGSITPLWLDYAGDGHFTTNLTVQGIFTATPNTNCAFTVSNGVVFVNQTQSSGVSPVVQVGFGGNNVGMSILSGDGRATWFSTYAAGAAAAVAMAIVDGTQTNLSFTYSGNAAFKGSVTIPGVVTFGTTNSGPTFIPATSTPRIWIPFTNGTTVYYMPGY